MRPSWLGLKEMYHRGGDQDWHQRPQRDIFPPRNHQSTPYRGGYHTHREPNHYGPYDHNACHDRNYADGQYIEYEGTTYQNYPEENRPYPEKKRPYPEEHRPYHAEKRPYHEENRPYHDHRDPREQGYHSRGRYDGGYQKDFRGGYRQNHEESSRYDHSSKSQHKKYPYKSSKPYVKESDDRIKTSTVKPVESVDSVTSASGSSENPSESRVVASQDKNLEQEIAKSAQQDAKTVPEGTIAEENKKPTQDETKSVQNDAKATDETKPAQGSAEPLIEDPKLFSEIKKPSEESVKHLHNANAAKVVVKVEPVESNTQMSSCSGEPVCDTKGTTGLTTPHSCKIEGLEDTKKDIQTWPVFEEKKDFSITGVKQEETFFGKRHCQTEDQLLDDKTEIPLLGSWADMPSSYSKEAAGSSTKRHPETFSDYGLSRTAQDLRKTFILAKKDEIELAFSQDCRTFAFVASTLLKKDPSLEVAVSNALRSTLQDISGRCVQELSKFIDHYDSIPVNISERLQNSDI